MCLSIGIIDIIVVIVFWMKNLDQIGYVFIILVY